MSKEKEITKSDLLESENRINKEQQQARHSQNSNIQLALSKADEALNENKLLNHSLQTMNKNFEKLDSKLDDALQKIEDKIDKFIESCDKKYADKQTVSSLLWVVRIIGGAVITAFTWAILKIMWIIWN